MRWSLAAVVLAAGCSGVTQNADGIASLEITLPANTFLEPGLAVRLRAVARNKSGDSVAVPIRWRTADTTLSVDSTTGIVRSLAASGTGRIQVGVYGKDTLATSFGTLSFTLTARADTLTLSGSDSITVARDSDPPVTVTVALLGGAPAVGVAGRPVAVRMVEPAPNDSSALVFNSNRAADSLTTGGTAGSAAATLRVFPGRRPPDRAVIAFTAFHATGQPIPGSGRRVVIRYLHQ